MVLPHLSFLGLQNPLPSAPQPAPHCWSVVVLEKAAGLLSIGPWGQMDCRVALVGARERVREGGHGGYVSAKLVCETSLLFYCSFNKLKKKLNFFNL